MNIITSELWAVPLFFFGVAVAFYLWAAKRVKEGKYSTETDANGKLYQRINPNAKAHWYEHKSGKAAIVMAIIAVISIWIVPYCYTLWG